MSHLLCHLRVNSDVQMCVPLHAVVYLLMYGTYIQVLCACIIFLTFLYDALLRSQDLFPWKQRAEGEMATPPKWEKRLVPGLANQVSAQTACTAKGWCTMLKIYDNDPNIYDMGSFY